MESFVAINGDTNQKVMLFEKGAERFIKECSVCLQGLADSSLVVFQLIYIPNEEFKKGDAGKKRLTALKHEIDMGTGSAKFENFSYEILGSSFRHEHGIAAGSVFCFIAVKAVAAF